MLRQVEWRLMPAPVPVARWQAEASYATIRVVLFEIIHNHSSIINPRVGWAVAGCESSRRKVRAGQGTVVANGHRRQLQGKCHRKHTADGPLRAQAKVKRCGKSAPRRRRRRRQGKPHRLQDQAAGRRQGLPSPVLGGPSRTEPGCERPRSLGRRVGRFPLLRRAAALRGGRASRQRLVQINDRHSPTRRGQNSAYRPTLGLILCANQNRSSISHGSVSVIASVCCCGLK